MRKFIALATLLILLMFLSSMNTGLVLAAGQEVMLTWQPGEDPNSISESISYVVWWDIVPKSTDWTEPKYSNCLNVGNALQHVMTIDPNQGIHFLYVTAVDVSGFESGPSNVEDTKCPPCPKKLKIYLKK